MKKHGYLIYLAFFVFHSCVNKPANTLEINFTSNNNDSINVLKSFYLTKLYPLTRHAFHNVQSLAPNKFELKIEDTGRFIGLLQIEGKGSLYNIVCDSITINEGKNHFDQEINLGPARLIK